MTALRRSAIFLAGCSGLVMAAPAVGQDKAGDGFTVDPKGYVQLDFGSIGNPGNLNPQDFGANGRARRIVLSAEGKLGGGFGYKAEFNLAEGKIGYEDVFLSYAMKDTPLQFQAGHFYTLSGLETMTSSRLTSFLERSLANDGFGFSRRVGLSAGLVDKDGGYTVTAGIFNAPMEEAFSDGRWLGAVRGTVSPKLGGGRLHIGVNYQHRVADEDSQNIRYRARPATQLTDFRFVDTGSLAARGDDVYGIELAGIFGPFHFAAEGHKARPRQLAGVDQPGFKSGYVELGYYLTGETRGYKNGRWDKAKIKAPIGKSGAGAWQINGRFDTIDLAERRGDGSLVNGGRQDAYQASLIWMPVDYVRLLLQYTRIEVQGGPRAATVVPDPTTPASERRYDSDVVALRAQVEF